MNVLSLTYFETISYHTLNFLDSNHRPTDAFRSRSVLKPLRGSTDNLALNYDFLTDENDGSCQYSKATFFAKYPAFNGVPIISIAVIVNGSEIGTITQFYPNSPGNCSASGTVFYQFESGNRVDWNTVVHLETGAIITGSGEVAPSSFSQCIKVNVTK